MEKLVWFVVLSILVSVGLVGISLKARAVDYNGNPSSIRYSKDGHVAVWIRGGGGIRVKVTAAGKQKNISHTGGIVKHQTNLAVKSGESVAIEVWDPGGKAVGWQSPNGIICGSGAPLPPTGGRSQGSYAKIDIADFIRQAETDDNKLESIQCWADSPEWSGDKDFNDYFMIFSYGEESDDPEDPEEKTTKLQIRKFKDTDLDGVWDSDEIGTGEVFEFSYQINDGETKEYFTDPGTGRGLFIEVNSGDKITVTEKQKDGWRSTTGLTQTVTVSNNETYFLDFGNVQDRVETPTPSITPETGICSKC